MCNEYQLRVGRGPVDWEFRQLDIPLTWADAEPNRPLDRPIRPTDRAPILRPVDPLAPAAGLRGEEARWKLLPFFHKGPLADFRPMTTNARVEGLETTATFREPYACRRCLAPLTSFIEYDAPPGWKKGERKRRWEIGWPGDAVRFFAGLWDFARPADHPEGLLTFAIVTGPAGPDMARIHTRQPAVLTAAQGMAWLGLDGPGKALLAPSPAGALDLAERPRDLDLID